MFGRRKGNFTLLLLSVFILAQVLVFSYSKPSHVWLQNGYSDIVVSLPKDAPEGSKIAIIETIQDLFIYSSRVLYRATKRRATFNKVIILVPSSWSVSEALLSQKESNSRVFESNGGFPSFFDADIVLSQNLGDRKIPYVLQDEGCGKTGLRINMPVEFLLSDRNITSKSTEFIHYWSQYRYGVFPEGGFQNDIRYPQYYSIPGMPEIHITDCSNIPLTSSFTTIPGDGICKPYSDVQTGKPILPDCKQTPLVEDPDMLISSIMYQQALPYSSYFCEGDQDLERRHNPSSPSKHNILCSQEATLSVILRSPDFTFGKNPASRYKSESVSFQFVQESNIRVVIAVDVSSSIRKNGRYGLIKNAVRNFVLNDLSLGSDFGLVSFDEDIKTFRRMISLPTEAAKREFFRSNPFYDNLDTSSNDVCLECAIEFSLQLLRNVSERPQNGIIVIVSTNGSLAASTNTSLEDNLKSDGTRLFVLLFADGESDNYEALESLVSVSKGSLVQVPEKRKLQTLSNLYLSFHGIVSALTSFSNENNILFIKEIPANATVVAWDFHVDASVTQDLTLLISGPDFDIMQSVLVVEQTNLTSPSGEVEKRRSEFVIPAWTFTFPSAETGKYTFFAKRRANIPGDCFAIVFGKLASNVTNSITLRTWTNHRSPEVSEPLKLFAEVNYGSHPIINAKVIATIHGPDGAFLSSFELLDNGLGDPDITKHDGIYTRYCDISEYSLNGYYTVTFDASGDESEIMYISNGNCCGSFAPFVRKEAIGPFNRATDPLTFRLSGKQPLNNFIAPNRILDLRIHQIRDDQGTVTLRWTAAGAHLDHGAASSYRLKLFGDRITAKRRFEETGSNLEYNREIVQFTPSKDYGNLMEYTVQLPETLRTGFYYFAVKAVDISGRNSAVSNVVEAYLNNPLYNNSISCDSFQEPDAASNLCEKLSIIIICLISRLIINYSFNV